MATLETLRRTAEEVRYEFETGAISTDYIMQLGHEYGLDKNVLYSWERQMAEGKITGFPDGWCERTTVVLLDRAEGGEFVQGSYGKAHDSGALTPPDRYHAFRIDTDVAGLPDEWEGQQIVSDIAADQFSGPGVYVGPLVEPWSRSQNWWNP